MDCVWCILARPIVIGMGCWCIFRVPQIIKKRIRSTVLFWVRWSAVSRLYARLCGGMPCLIRKNTQQHTPHRIHGDTQPYTDIMWSAVLPYTGIRGASRPTPPGQCIYVLLLRRVPYKPPPWFLAKRMSEILFSKVVCFRFKHRAHYRS